MLLRGWLILKVAVLHQIFNNFNRTLFVGLVSALRSLSYLRSTVIIISLKIEVNLFRNAEVLCITACQ